MADLSGKNIVVGVTGGIACYKACEVVSSLKKLGASVRVVMTKNAQEFVAPLTFESLTGNSVITDMFAQKTSPDIEHISIAKQADLFLIAPCTANVVGKLACGIADDFLTTTAMATKAPIIIAPAMNTNMIMSDAYNENAKKLLSRGVHFIASDQGRLACGDTGKGRLAEPQIIVDYIINFFDRKQDFKGKTFLITSGPTISPIDPVRYISNYSSGKMGVEIAKAALHRGANVILVLGRTASEINLNCETIKVNTTNEMLEAVIKNMDRADFIIKAAAPSDYDIEKYSSLKIKDEKLVLSLSKTVDIAAEVGNKKSHQKLVVFAAETDNLIENAKKKLETKNADMVVANNILKEGAGFNVDTNIASIITKSGCIDFDLMTKRELAEIILDNLLKPDDSGSNS